MSKPTFLSRPSSFRRSGLFSVLFLLPTVFGGCLYKADDRCGKNQIYKDEFCVCTDDAALVDGSCVVCSAHETPGEGECVCDDGYARSSTGICEKADIGIGEKCSKDANCPDKGANTCVSDAAGSFCTVTGCKTASDCPAQWGCETGKDPSYCTRPPSGLDTACASSDECSKFEANYCETAQEKKCKVNCLEDPGSCHGDWVCCDFSPLIGAALCVSPTDLDDGACPYGVEKLEAK